MTKVEVYSKVKAILAGEVVIDTLTAEEVTEISERMDKDIEIASKRATSSTAKTNDAKVALMADIKAILADANGGLTIPEIIKALGGDTYTYGEGEKAKSLNSQIVSQALVALGEGSEKAEGTHEVTREIIKKVAHFSLAK